MPRLYFIDNLPALDDLERTNLINLNVEAIGPLLSEIEIRCRPFMYESKEAWRDARRRLREAQLRMLEDATRDIIKEIRSLRGNDDGTPYDPGADLAEPGLYQGFALNELNTQLQNKLNIVTGKQDEAKVLLEGILNAIQTQEGSEDIEALLGQIIILLG